jgi:predicted TPR repeat methyltransferase
MANARLAFDGDPIAEADALIAEGRAGEAAALLERRHMAGRGGLLLQTARVRAFIAAGNAQAAMAVAREASTLYPGIAAVAVTLGEALLACGHPAAAIGEFHRALRLDPRSDAARYRLGCAWLAAGEAGKAADAFAEIVAAPDGLAKKLAEIEAMRACARSDPRYVRHLFDQFSADYDQRMLGQLGYGAPQILRNLAGLIGLRGPLAILDLGCGTGLGGAAFKDLAMRLDGVDLSPAMIAKARERGIYDDLRIGDIEAALVEPGHGYDLLLAADTLVYLGDLAPLFAAAAQRLAPRGVFLFTVERKDGESFELGPKRRWRHSENYLHVQALAAGFEITGFLECSPRTEAGVPVEGYAVALERR